MVYLSVFLYMYIQMYRAMVINILLPSKKYTLGIIKMPSDLESQVDLQLLCILRFEPKFHNVWHYLRIAYICSVHMCSNV